MYFVMSDFLLVALTRFILFLCMYWRCVSWLPHFVLLVKKNEALLANLILLWYLTVHIHLKKVS